MLVGPREGRYRRHHRWRAEVIKLAGSPDAFAEGGLGGERSFFGVAGGSEGFLLGGFLDRALKGRALWLRKAVSFGCGREWRSGRWLAIVRVRNVVQERRRPAVRVMAPRGTVVVGWW